LAARPPRQGDAAAGPILRLGLFILAAKLAAMQVVHVDNPPKGL
jgi:hypothetical protein